MNGPEDGIRVEDVIAMAANQIAVTDADPEAGTVTGTPINQFELRGYEVAKLLRDGSWERVSMFRPNDLALAQANADCTFLNGQGRATYQVRGLVSVELPKRPQEPLVLEADNDGTGPSQDDAGAATPQAEGDAAQSGESTPSSDEAGEHDIGGEG